MGPVAVAQVDGSAHVTSDWVESTLTKAERATDDVLKAAAAFGTTAHDHIDRLVRGEVPVAVPPEVAPVVEGFKRWHAQSGLDLNPAGDTVVYSTKYGYAGALDCVGTRRSDGGLVIVDFKTSNSIHTTYAMQLAAYVNAYKELFGLEAGGWSHTMAAHTHTSRHPSPHPTPHPHAHAPYPTPAALSLPSCEAACRSLAAVVPCTTCWCSGRGGSAVRQEDGQL